MLFKKELDMNFQCLNCFIELISVFQCKVLLVVDFYNLVGARDFFFQLDELLVVFTFDYPSFYYIDNTKKLIQVDRRLYEILHCLNQ